MIHIVVLTFRELARRRFFAGAALTTAALVGLTGWGFSYLGRAHGPRGPITHFEVLAIAAVLLILIAYLFSFLLAMAAVFISAPALANDIESGILLPVVTRPLQRSSIACGKGVALAIVVAAYTFATGACEFAVVRAVTGYLPPHPLVALGYLAISAIVMVALGLLLSTRMTSIGASIVAIALFIIARLGGIAQSIGSFYHNDAIRHAGTVSQLLLPSDAMWQAALYRLEPAATVASLSNSPVWQGPFFVTAPPPAALVAWTFAWIVVITALAMRSLTLRDL